MKKNRMIKLLMFIIIGILLYFVMETIIGDVVSVDLLSKVKSNEDMPPFYWLIIIVGGSITITLAYVGIRKYKGEKKARQKQDNDKYID